MGGKRHIIAQDGRVSHSGVSYKTPFVANAGVRDPEYAAISESSRIEPAA